MCTCRYKLMLKCWEADVDNRICFKEIVAELTKEAGKVCATENSDDLNYVTVMPCHITELTKEHNEICTTENSASVDYVTIMPSHMPEPSKEPSEVYGTDNSANVDYVTVKPCQKIDS